MQLVRERFTYAEANGDTCLFSYYIFDHYQDVLRIIRGKESKKGWIDRYNLEASASTRHRHKKSSPVFDLILMASVKADSEPVKYSLQNRCWVTADDVNFQDLAKNHFEDVSITVCLVATIPKPFLLIEQGKPALFDTKNEKHVAEINKRLKSFITGAERFSHPQNIEILKHYKIAKRKAKLSPEKAEAKYQKDLRIWEKEFARDPENARDKPKKTSVSKQEWTVCLSDSALKTVRSALDGLTLSYQKNKKLPNGTSIFLNDVDRVHGFLSKYIGHRGVRSDIGREYTVFRRDFRAKCKNKLDALVGEHTLKLNYLGQLKDEYKHWEFAHNHPKDNLELMMLRAILKFYENHSLTEQNS